MTAEAKSSDNLSSCSSLDLVNMHHGRLVVGALGFIELDHHIRLCFCRQGNGIQGIFNFRLVIMRDDQYSLYTCNAGCTTGLIVLVFSSCVTRMLRCGA
jgi:hypothetical protein